MKASTISVLASVLIASGFALENANAQNYQYGRYVQAELLSFDGKKMYMKVSNYASWAPPRFYGIMLITSVDPAFQTTLNSLRSGDKFRIWAKCTASRDVILGPAGALAAGGWLLIGGECHVYYISVQSATTSQATSTASTTSGSTSSGSTSSGSTTSASTNSGSTATGSRSLSSTVTRRRASSRNSLRVRQQSSYGGSRFGSYNQVR